MSAAPGAPADELELKARVEHPEALRAALAHAGAATQLFFPHEDTKERQRHEGAVVFVASILLRAFVWDDSFWIASSLRSSQ